MKVVEILRREASLKGRSVVVVTHDPALVAVADVVFALRGGHLLPAQEKIAK
jgi:ABC-type lipoprotein export system ATPase subunit